MADMAPPPGEVWVEVEYEYEYKSKSRTIKIQPGEIFILLKKANEDWWQVAQRSEASSSSSKAKSSSSRSDSNKPFYVPAQYVREVRRALLPKMHHNHPSPPDSKHNRHEAPTLPDSNRPKHHKHDKHSAHSDSDSDSEGVSKHKHKQHHGSSSSFKDDSRSEHTKREDSKKRHSSGRQKDDTTHTSDRDSDNDNDSQTRPAIVPPVALPRTHISTSQKQKEKQTPSSPVTHSHITAAHEALSPSLDVGKIPLLPPNVLAKMKSAPQIVPRCVVDETHSSDKHTSSSSTEDVTGDGRHQMHKTSDATYPTTPSEDKVALMPPKFNSRLSTSNTQKRSDNNATATQSKRSDNVSATTAQAHSHADTRSNVSPTLPTRAHTLKPSSPTHVAATTTVQNRRGETPSSSSHKPQKTPPKLSGSSLKETSSSAQHGSRHTPGRTSSLKNNMSAAGGGGEGGGRGGGGGGGGLSSSSSSSSSGSSKHNSLPRSLGGKTTESVSRPGEKVALMPPKNFIRTSSWRRKGGSLPREEEKKKEEEEEEEEERRGEGEEGMEHGGEKERTPSWKNKGALPPTPTEERERRERRRSEEERDQDSNPKSPSWRKKGSLPRTPEERRREGGEERDDRKKDWSSSGDDLSSTGSLEFLQAPPESPIYTNLADLKLSDGTQPPVPHDTHTHSHAEWETHTDTQSGRVYYYNPHTRESRWKPPREKASPPSPSSAHFKDSTNGKSRSLERRQKPEPTVRPKWRHSSQGVEDFPKPRSPSPESSSPTSPTATQGDKSGVLNVTKYAENGKRIRKNWNSSFVVLEGANLSFFKTSWFGSHQSSPEFVVDLRGALSSWTKDKSSKKNVVEVKSHNCATEILLQSDSESTMAEWQQAIMDSIHTHEWDSEEEDMEEEEQEDSKKHPDRADQRKRTKLRKFLTRRPTLQTVKDKGYIKDLVFGCSLVNLCEREKSTVPHFVQMCIERVEHNGLNVDGLYRVSGNLAVIQKLKFAVNHNESVDLLDSNWGDTHITSGALKMFFRELAEPLFTHTHHQDFVDAIKTSDYRQRVECVRTIVKRLPPAHHDTMRALFKHLRRVIDHGDQNRMSAPSVAIVFGPTLLRPEVESWNMAVNMVYQNQIVELVLLEQDTIFK